MNKIAHYLQEHLHGEVMDSADARRYFSVDNSIITITPSVIVYPLSESDVRKATRFCWRLAERGRPIPITPRGSGTDASGAAIGQGVLLVFPAHMNKIVELDSKTGIVVVEPGINYGKLQQTLHTHNRFLPPYPATIEYSTVGGAVANNAGGEKSVKYGATSQFVRGLRVVLANGEVIETGLLNKRDLSKKLGLTNLEGEIYRSLDTLIEENTDLVASLKQTVSRNSAGYNIADVKTKKGFDLTPLFVGSQGTLGVITEIILQTEFYSPATTLVVALFEDLAGVQDAIAELRQLQDSPSSIEIVDDNFLNLVKRINPNYLKGVLPDDTPKFILLVEFDDSNDRAQKKLSKKAAKIFSKYASSHQLEQDEEKQQDLWKIRRASSLILSYVEGSSRALPMIEDGIVPVDQFAEYVTGLREIFKRNHTPLAIWGHAGEGNLQIHPFLDLNQVGDRQKVFRLLEEYYSLVIELGGSTSGGNNDGRIRAVYLEKLFGKQAVELFHAIKKIVDPYNILNPGVKLDADQNIIKNSLRHSYSTNSYDNLPQS